MLYKGLCRCESAPVGRGKLAHKGVYFAGGNRHDKPLDGANLFVCDLLLLGHAKVVLDSWLALPGYRRSQSDHRRGAGIEMLLVADGIVEIAVGFMLFGWKHQLMLFSCVLLVSESPRCLCNKLLANFQQY